MRHAFECPMRWADLNQHGQVGHAVYVDYLQEARVDMLRVHARDRRADDLAEGVVVVRHAVQYVEPLAFRPEPVRIETWVTEVRAASFTLAYEVVDQLTEGRRVHLRATTVLTPYVFTTERPRRITADEREALERYRAEAPSPDGAVPSAAPPTSATEWAEHPVHVRFSDVDVYGHVNNVKYFEYFAEARQSAYGDLVVARCDVDYRRPILFREEPYTCATAVVDTDEDAVTVAQEIRDGEEVLARARVALVAAG